MVPLRTRIRNTTTKIARTINEDETLKHCRINVINGANEVFKKYKDALNTEAIVDDGTISVRYYTDHKILHEDLFVDPNFMSHNWFNLFVFNIES